MSRTLKMKADEALDSLVLHLAEIKAKSDAAKQARDETAPRVMEELRKAGQKSRKVQWSDTHDVVARIKTRDTSQIDAERLKKAIGAKQYNRLTSPQLDEAKVESAIQLGELDQNVVSQCMEERKSEYIETRFVKRNRNEQESSRS
jgi:hypothetical protein